MNRHHTPSAPPPRRRLPAAQAVVCKAAIWRPAILILVGWVVAALGNGPRAAVAQDPFADARATMVNEQIRRRDITDPAVLAAFGSVPRHLFVPEAMRSEAYGDRPLPIGEGQTITQPYVAAMMTSLLDLDADARVLEVGTGSGYQAAVLAEIAAEVYTIEIRDGLGQAAARLLGSLGYRNVSVRIGDGYRGWPEKAPFDAIVVSAAPPHVPEPLIAQLAVGGRMVIPVGGVFQDLLVITKTQEGVETREVIPVRFVPMSGEASRPPG